MRLALAGRAHPGRPDGNRFIDSQNHILRLLLILVTSSAVLTACVSDQIGGPTAPKDAKDAGLLTLPSGRSYPVYPQELAYSGEAGYRWPDGRTFDGSFMLGQPDGMGTGTWPDGTHYRGTWQHGTRHGHGELSRQDGSRYVGDFVNGLRAGDGVEQSGEGLYRGTWANDLPNGQGEFHGTDGASYEGYWHDGRRQGQGSYVDANGNRYVGEWHADVPHGFGVLTNANSSSYEGQWRASLQNGYGISISESGVVYEGTWRDGKRQGFGVASRPDGSRYEGEWVAGRRQGQGRESFADGSYHQGTWESDQPLGPGTRRDRTGIEITGVWTGDSFNSGIMRLPSGAEYAGRLLRKRNTVVEPGLMDWLEARAEAQDPHAQFFLGTAYTDFQSPSPDPFRATGYFRRAARAGVPDAQFRLALLLMDKTPEQAMDWLARAAAAGQAQANALLGEYYLTGNRVDRDLDAAVRYLQAGSSAGDMTARNNLAWILSTADDPAFRDGQRALGLIRPLALFEGGWQHFDTLAAAYAALGDFELAVNAQKTAIKLASATADATASLMATRIAEMYRRLDGYEAGRTANGTQEQ